MLLLSLNPFMLFISQTTLSLYCDFTSFTFKFSRNELADMVNELVICSRNCTLIIQSLGLVLVRHLRKLLEMLG